MAIRRAETGERGFLLTGKDNYLAPYKDAIDHVGFLQGELQRLTADNLAGQERLRKLAPVVQHKLEELAQAVQLRRDVTFDAALRIVQTETGRIEFGSRSPATLHQPRRYGRQRPSTAFLPAPKRAQAENVLREAQKMQAIGHLTGGVAHDFNNLLTVIVGNLELAHTKSDNLGILKSRLERATSAAHRGAALTSQLLEQNPITLAHSRSL